MLWCRYNFSTVTSRKLNAYSVNASCGCEKVNYWASQTGEFFHNLSQPREISYLVTSILWYIGTRRTAKKRKMDTALYLRINLEDPFLNPYIEKGFPESSNRYIAISSTTGSRESRKNTSFLTILFEKDNGYKYFSLMLKVICHTAGIKARRKPEFHSSVSSSK